MEKTTSDYQDVHLGAHETAVGIRGSADERFATDVEAGIDQQPIAGQFLEGRYE